MYAIRSYYGFVATDAVVASALLQPLVSEAADLSFNRITIDGDTSTNDSFVLVATRLAGHEEITSLDSADGRALRFAQRVIQNRQPGPVREAQRLRLGIGQGPGSVTGRLVDAHSYNFV